MSISSKTETLQEQHQKFEFTDQDRKIFGRLSLIDLRILRKFYFTGRSFPSDIRGFTVMEIVAEMGRHKIRYTHEGIRKLLNRLVVWGLLDKIKSWPVMYNPIRNPEPLRAKFVHFFNNFFNESV